MTGCHCLVDQHTAPLGVPFQEQLCQLSWPGDCVASLYISGYRLAHVSMNICLGQQPLTLTDLSGFIRMCVLHAIWLHLNVCPACCNLDWPLRVWQVAKRTGASIDVIPESATGDIDIAALEALIVSHSRKPALIALVHVASNCGERVSSCSSPCLHHIAQAATILPSRQHLPPEQVVKLSWRHPSIAWCLAAHDPGQHLHALSQHGTWPAALGVLGSAAQVCMCCRTRL